MIMKTVFLVLMAASISALAQTNNSNDPATLRRALRTVTTGQTNATTPSRGTIPPPPRTTSQPPVQPAVTDTPPVTTPAVTETPGVETTPTTVVPVQGTTSVPATGGQPTDIPAGAIPTPGAVTPQAIPSPGTPIAQPAEEMVSPGILDFAAAELNQVLDLYADFVNRTILRAPNLASPPIVLSAQTPLTKTEAIQALDAVLGMHGIALINVGEKFVKAVPIAQADSEGAPRDLRNASELPELGQYVTHIVQLKTAKPSELVPVLQAFGKTKSILPVDSSQILVIRDYAENVKRMLEMIKEIDILVESDFTSEVIPIKYALADDIAGALNSLSGSGGGTTSVGGSAGGAGGLGGARTGTTGGRLGTTGGLGAGGLGGTRAGYNTTPLGGAGGIGGGGTGTPSSTTSFSDRLNSIIRRASSSGDVQILGQTKIIADARTNSLLIFATKADMAMIKDIISKLDVVLAQVLIEAIIMEVSLTGQRDLGISYAQRPQSHGSLSSFAGGILNGPIISPGSFANIASNSGLPSGFSYTASIKDDFDVTVTAAENDGRINVLSRPRIQTSHAVPAQLFIGDTVPYITGTTYGDFSGSTTRSQYQEKRVGITLDVLPLINPDGLVVMDIQQVIQQLGPTTIIDGNEVPTTTERTAMAKVAVKDRDTIILGGFISNTKGYGDSGVPFLKDIPLLGNLFRSSSRTKNRVELIVLMRPTVLPTPETAASIAAIERDKVPAFREIQRDEQRAERRALGNTKKEPKFRDP
jgi:general secretion pathway protein D